MITTTMETEHISTRQLVLCALEQGDIALEAHLAECDTCRSRVEAYRSVLVATREALTVSSGRVNFISLGRSLILESSECQVGDAQHTLRVTLRAEPDALHGQLTVDETCTCWNSAPVRLFGPHGLVASSRVDANREFRLPVLASSQRYSLGLVLTRHDVPELQIIGSFRVR